MTLFDGPHTHTNIAAYAYGIGFMGALGLGFALLGKQQREKRREKRKEKRKEKGKEKRKERKEKRKEKRERRKERQ